MEEKFQGKYRITTIRASWHDYRCGAYFVTICTKDREHYFGEIKNDEKGNHVMNLSQIGKIADECWLAIPQHFPHVQIPLWVVMPDHIHGIVIIDDFVEAQNFAPLLSNKLKKTFTFAEINLKPTRHETIFNYADFAAVRVHGHGAENICGAFARSYIY